MTCPPGRRTGRQGLSDGPSALVVHLSRPQRCRDAGIPDTAVCPEQVLVLSEGHQLYFGPPREAVNWFSSCLGYTVWPGQHGAEADWLMDLVSVGFSKPQALCSISMTSREDVFKASELWHAHCRKAGLHPLMSPCRACTDALAPAAALHTLQQSITACCSGTSSCLWKKCMEIA